jgi:hypothetical protein
MAEEKPSKKSIWNYYFRVRWQTALNIHFLIMMVYLSLFYIGNVWNAIKFAFFTIFSSSRMLGLDFAFWGVIFEVSVIIPFLICWYAIFLLPKIWQSKLKRFQQVFFTIIMFVMIPLIIVITDTVARYSLETEALREFVEFYRIIP